MNDDLTTTNDELLHACIRARDQIRAYVATARADVARWRPRPTPDDSDA